MKNSVLTVLIFALTISCASQKEIKRYRQSYKEVLKYAYSDSLKIKVAKEAVFLAPSGIFDGGLIDYNDLPQNFHEKEYQKIKELRSNFSNKNDNLIEFANQVNKDTLTNYNFIIYFTNAKLSSDTIGAEIFYYDREKKENIKNYRLFNSSYQFLLIYKNNKVDKVLSGEVFYN